MASTLRVRQVLGSLDSKQKQALLKLLPVSAAVPVVETGPYPSALLTSFPKAESYALLGCVAEALLRLPSSKIGLDALFLAIRHYLPTFSADAESKVRASKTTEPFLNRLVSTRMGLESVVRSEEGALRVEETIGSAPVVGHPDLRNDTQIFEIKLTGQLDKNWSAFLLQVFAYGALAEEATDLYLVLPLQTYLWHAEIGDWDEREDFKTLLVGYAQSVLAPSNLEAQLLAAMLLAMYNIGHHTQKQGSIAATIANLQDYSRPYQIFLSGNRNTKMNITDGDLAASLALVTKKNAKIYVHSQYLLNLCSVKEGDDWQVDVLKKNLQYTRAFGGKGVVVHVGSAKKMPIKDALETMRKAIAKCLDAATKDCPLLLETPAGEGTDTLTDMKEFLDFVDSFHDDRLRICLDTCHVFACGHNPIDYIQKALARPGLLKLIHYNDSKRECGSCVDRHAPIGLGHIGIEKMTEIAVLCSSAGLPMVVE
jgi:deoxyribonuclease-4